MLERMNLFCTVTSYYTDISWYKETHRLRWVFCYPCRFRTESARFESSFAGMHEPAHIGNFARKIGCTESRNDAHPLRRAAFLPPLPSRGVHTITRLFGVLDHRAILRATAKLYNAYRSSAARYLSRLI